MPGNPGRFFCCHQRSRRLPHPVRPSVQSMCTYSQARLLLFLPRSLLYPFFLFWALFRLRFSQTREIRMGRGEGKKRAIKRRRLAEKRNRANQGKGVVTNIIAWVFERRRRGKKTITDSLVFRQCRTKKKKEREHFARCPRTEECLTTSKTIRFHRT